MIVNKTLDLVGAVHLAGHTMDQRPLLSRPQCSQDWEDRKAVIMELYEFKTLKETMKVMEDEHSFKATYVTTAFCILYTNTVQCETVQETAAEVGYRSQTNQINGVQSHDQKEATA